MMLKNREGGLLRFVGVSFVGHDRALFPLSSFLETVSGISGPQHVLNASGCVSDACGRKTSHVRIDVAYMAAVMSFLFPPFS